MKKAIICLSMLAVFSSGIAQSTDGKKMKKTDFIGAPFIGLNAPLVTGSDSWKFGLIGVQFGFIVNVVDLNDQFGIRGEVNFSMEGSKYDESSYKGKVITNYINVPVVARFHSPRGFFAELGVQPGFLLSAKDKYDGGTDDVKDFYNGFDFGIPIGLGFETKSKIGIGLRIVPGVTNIYDDVTFGNDKNLNNSLRITYSF